MKKVSVPAVLQKLRQKKGPAFYIVIAVLIVAVLLAVAVIKRNNHQSCADINATPQKVLATKGVGAKSYNSIYKTLLKAPEACKDKNSSSTNAVSTKFDYYYYRARYGYRLGKISDAQADARQALALFKQLPDKTRNSEIYKDKQHSLKEMLEGTF